MVRVAVRVEATAEEVDSPSTRVQGSLTLLLFTVTVSKFAVWSASRSLVFGRKWLQPIFLQPMVAA